MSYNTQIYLHISAYQSEEPIFLKLRGSSLSPTRIQAQVLKTAYEDLIRESPKSLWSFQDFVRLITENHNVKQIRVDVDNGDNEAKITVSDTEFQTLREYKQYLEDDDHFVTRITITIDHNPLLSISIDTTDPNGRARYNTHSIQELQLK